MLARARALAGSLALAVAAMVATFLALEVGFRLFHVAVGTVQINRATIARSANPGLHFELRPGARARAEVEYRINALGLRGPETTLEKPAGRRRVAVLGDSIAFGYWVDEKDSFPRQLEGLLNDVRGAAPPVEALNFGVPGYNLDQEIEALRAKALATAPDLVVIAFCLNDLEGIFSHEMGLVQDRSQRERTVLGRIREELLARSLLVSWIEYRMAEREARRSFVRARNPLPRHLYDDAIGRQKAALVSKFDEVRSLLAPIGAPAVVAIFPALGGRFDRYPYRELHGAVSAAAKEAGLGVVDLLECYSAYDFRDLRVDAVHPSPMGDRVAAHAVRDALCAGAFSCASDPPPCPPCTAYVSSDFPVVRGY